ncbi:3255_t:CDS:2 [Funneliformis caledonium]|uniref:3255_t:CDS:1 n=1 Tax=Funneliformis caledonium TaxID=1117310 RepID=A0A9N9A5A0_9GLOM|nr:3255_t:CDS:2 [Funneliformis caledonium]
MSILHLQIGQQQKNIPNISQENPGHNNSINNSELTKSHSETVTKCHDQNSVLDDPNDDILESENQIVEGLVQELTSEFSFASGNESLNEGELKNQYDNPREKAYYALMRELFSMKAFRNASIQDEQAEYYKNKIDNRIADFIIQMGKDLLNDAENKGPKTREQIIIF